MSVLGIPILDNLYPATMDMWPIEAKEFNRSWPFYENLKQGRFTTTKCKDCGNVSYPPRVICPSVLGEPRVHRPAEEGQGRGLLRRGQGSAPGIRVASHPCRGRPRGGPGEKAPHANHQLPCGTLKRETKCSSQCSTYRRCPSRRAGPAPSWQRGYSSPSSR